MLCYCPVLTGPFPLSSSMVQLHIYSEVEMTSQDSRQLPGEAPQIKEDLSKSPEGVKNEVPGRLLLFPVGPLGPVDCPQTLVPPALSSVLKGCLTLDGVDQAPPHPAEPYKAFLWLSDHLTLVSSSSGPQPSALDAPMDLVRLSLFFFTFLHILMFI